MKFIQSPRNLLCAGFSFDYRVILTTDYSHAIISHMNLGQFIEEQPIKVISEPFPHIIADNFFKKDFYDSLCALLNGKLNEGLEESRNNKKFSRFDRYDAYSWNPDPRGGMPMALFNSPEWEKYITDFFGIKPSHDLDTCFHHHLAGSQDGWAHNDFNVCSFKEDRLPNGMNPWHHQCVYADDTLDRQPETRKAMRAIALLFYLNNDPAWRDGDGGETGVYASYDTGKLLKKIAPINNRLFAFRISPSSFHGFLSNKKKARNTINQWFHREPMSALQEFNVSIWEEWKK